MGNSQPGSLVRWMLITFLLARSSAQIKTCFCLFLHVRPRELSSAWAWQCLLAQPHPAPNGTSETPPLGRPTRALFLHVLRMHPRQREALATASCSLPFQFSSSTVSVLPLRSSSFLLCPLPSSPTPTPAQAQSRIGLLWGGDLSVCQVRLLPLHGWVFPPPSWWLGNCRCPSAQSLEAHLGSSPRTPPGMGWTLLLTERHLSALGALLRLTTSVPTS